MNPENIDQLDRLDRSIINAFQNGFPLTSRPYKKIAEQFAIPEQEVLERLNRLQNNKIISRIGAIITPNTIGVSTLCAMTVEQNELDNVAQIINDYDEVNHNYQRSHQFNLWFVVTAQNQAHLSKILDSITARTGYTIVNLPLETAYYLNLGFRI